MKKKVLKIWHSWDVWECFRAGFYGPFPKGMNKSKGEKLYSEFFRTPGLFETALTAVLKEWVCSCEQNLTYAALNKIAWGGQAACCYAWGVPAECRAGYSLLTQEEQQAADAISERLIRNWYEEHGYEQPEKI